MSKHRPASKPPIADHSGLVVAIRKAVAMLDDSNRTALDVRRPVAEVLKKALGENENGK